MAFKGHRKKLSEKLKCWPKLAFFHVETTKKLLILSETYQRKRFQKSVGLLKDIAKNYGRKTKNFPFFSKKFSTITFFCDHLKPKTLLQSLFLVSFTWNIEVWGSLHLKRALFRQKMSIFPKEIGNFKFFDHNFFPWPPRVPSSSAIPFFDLLY